MDKTLITVDVPNVISIGIILLAVMVLVPLVVTYAKKWTMGRNPDMDNSGSSF